jgi:hypothetical protein
MGVWAERSAAAAGVRERIVSGIATDIVGQPEQFIGSATGAVALAAVGQPRPDAQTPPALVAED